MFPKRRLAMLAIACCLSYSAQAEQVDRDKPLNVQADNCKHNQKTAMTTCSGNVIVTQGSMVIHAEKLEMRTDNDGNQFASGEGNPISFRQKLDKGADELTAGSLRFEYDGKKGLLQLSERAWVKRNEDKLEGDFISYDLNAEETKIKNNQGGRANIVFIPKKKVASSPDGKTAP